MSLSRRSLLGVAGLSGFALSAVARAADPLREAVTYERITLWPNGAPESVPAGLMQQFVERSPSPDTVKDRALKGVTAPFMDAYRPSQSNGASVLIMPGGGYRRMVWDKEGIEIAGWFMSRGVTCFILGYRLPPEGWASGADAPLADAQRAIRLIRRDATKWGIDPERIAAMGFSAGGHLCANLAAQFDRKAAPAVDAADALTARPCLAVPVYPAILLESLNAAFPKGESLFGKNRPAAESAQHSPHLHVPVNAPPHIMVQAEDDPTVSPDNVVALRAALKAKNIPAETHMFEKGGHGFGIRFTTNLPVADWPQRVLSFGQNHGWL
jgi:acetyl esterase/lipase